MNKATILNLPLKQKLVFLSIPLLLIAAFTIKFSVTGQQADQGLEISPPSQEVSVNPGEKITIKSSIMNRGTNAVPITVRIEDFTAVGDEGQVELTNDTTYSIKNWGNVTPNKFTLQPGSEQEVTATFTVPKDAAGGRYGSFVFSVAGKGGADAAALSQEIASLFLVRISGPVDEKLTLLSFDVPRFSEFGPIPFGIKVNNSGNVHVKAYGLINVTDMFGRKVKDVMVYETNVFPGAERTITASLPNKFLLGKYTATSIIYYGSDQKDVINTASTFYVFPVRIAAVILVIIIVIFLFRKRLKKALRALGGK